LIFMIFWEEFYVKFDPCQPILRDLRQL